mmetsp:Transcript_9784/g.14432  ORF Transcript_9784/g.14432 Transcript_9784/m.14432 type:complete len:166 (-) Transcript_9784:40-537(-)
MAQKKRLNQTFKTHWTNDKEGTWEKNESQEIPFAQHTFEQYKQAPIKLGGALPLGFSQSVADSPPKVKKFDPLQSWKEEAIQNYQKESNVNVHRRHKKKKHELFKHIPKVVQFSSSSNAIGSHHKDTKHIRVYEETFRRARDEQAQYETIYQPPRKTKNDGTALM